MFLKPKSTQLNMPASLYKRINQIEISRVEVYYQEVNSKQTWVYDQQIGGFVPKVAPENAKIMPIVVGFTIKDNKNNVFYRLVENITTENHFLEWVEVQEKDLDLLSHSLMNTGNIGKYQLNKYIFDNSFNYNIRGKIEEGIGEPISGLRTPMHSLTIVTYDDVKLIAGDLVVLNGRLYSIESVAITQKRLPRVFTLQHATLNSLV